MKSDNLVCPAARREALEVYRTPVEQLAPCPITLASIEQLSATKQAELDDAVKSRYYGVLGQVIEHVLDRTMASPIATAPLERRLLTLGKFAKLDCDIQYSLDTGIDRTIEILGGSTLLSTAEDLNNLRLALKPFRTSSLKGSLKGGAGTAVFTTIQLIRHFKAYKGNMSDRDFESALRKSYGSVIDIASINASQTRMVGELLERQQLPVAQYDPIQNRFKLETPVTSVPLTHSMRARLPGDAQNSTTIFDSKNQTPIIGCPILLKPNQMKQLWNWTIDETVARKLV